MYNCKYCNKEFKDKGNLHRHEKYFHEVSIEKIACPFCYELFEKCGVTTHQKSCKLNPNRFISKEELRKERSKNWYYIPGNCQFCGRYCKNGNSLTNHERLCKENPNRQIIEPHQRGSYHKGEPAWNKGLTKYTDERIARASEVVKNYYKTHDGTFKGKHHSEETKLKLRSYALENESQKHFGRHKNFIYKDVNFQSSYELQVAQDLDLHNIKWESAKRLPYIDCNGLNHYYTADLYLPEYDIYLDPKNDFLIENINPYFGYKDKDKIQWVMTQNNVKIIILDKDHLTWETIEPLIQNMYGE